MKVGAYRLDMVAICGKKMVAIECDGERWHSGEAKIREDMERQTILERIGWRFIRIRGSEYYRDAERAIERVISELAKWGIQPEETEITTPENRNTELLCRVKNRAAVILGDADDLSGEMVNKTVETALDSKNMMLDNIPQNIAFFSAETTRMKSLNSMLKSDEQSNRPSLENKSSMMVKRSFNLKSKEDKKNSSQEILKPVQTKLSGLEDTSLEDEDVISLLRKYKVNYIDKRSKGGALWLIGGKELVPVVSRLRNLGFEFRFKKDGGKVTKGKGAWWVK